MAETEILSITSLIRENDDKGHSLIFPRQDT